MPLPMLSIFGFGLLIMFSCLPGLVKPERGSSLPTLKLCCSALWLNLILFLIQHYCWRSMLELKLESLKDLFFSVISKLCSSMDFRVLRDLRSVCYALKPIPSGR